MTSPGLRPEEASLILREARGWHGEGLLGDEQYAALEARYGPLAAGHDGQEGSGGFMQKALVALGVTILGIAVLFTVSVFWDNLTEVAQLTLLLGIAAAFAAGGSALTRIDRARGLGFGLMAVAAVLVPFAAILARDAFEPGPARLAFAALTILAPAALLVLGHRRNGPLAFVSYLALFGGILIAAGLAGMEETSQLVTLADTALILYTVAFVALHVQERRVRSRWVEWALGANALIAIPLVFGTLETYAITAFGDYTGIVALALVGGAFFAIGLSRRMLPPAVTGALLLAGTSLWLGGEFGDTLGVVLVLFAEAGLLIFAGQSLGWGRVRSRFRSGPPGPPEGPKTS